MNKQFSVEAYTAPCQTSKMDLFPKMVKSLQPFTIFAKNLIIDVLQGSVHTYADLKHIYFISKGKL